MKNLFKYFLFATTFCLQTLFGQTFDVQFNPSINDGANLQLEIQVRLNTPPAPAANTLNSVTFDVIYSDALAAVPGLLTYNRSNRLVIYRLPKAYTVSNMQHVQVTVKLGLLLLEGRWYC